MSQQKQRGGIKNEKEKNKSNRKCLELLREYSSPPNLWLVYERVGMYQKYLETGEIPELLERNTISNNAELFLRYGDGFLLDSTLESWLFGVIYCSTGKLPRFRNFRVKIRLETAEEVTCKSCPDFSDCCGFMECRSMDAKELAKRKEIALYGKKSLSNANQ